MCREEVESPRRMIRMGFRHPYPLMAATAAAAPSSWRLRRVEQVETRRGGALARVGESWYLEGRVRTKVREE